MHANTACGDVRGCEGTFAMLNRKSDQLDRWSPQQSFNCQV